MPYPVDKPDELPYSKRYTRGRLIAGAVWPNHVDLALDEPRNGIGLVRVPREHWLDAQLQEGHEWQDGFSADVFLFNLSSEARSASGHGHWFGSFRFAEEANNPWCASHPQHPMAGKMVRGRVERIAGQRWGIVRLESGNGEPSLLDASVERSAVPGGSTSTGLDSLLRLFPVGLQIEAEIDRVIEEVRRCRLSP